MYTGKKNRSCSIYRVHEIQLKRRKKKKKRKKKTLKSPIKTQKK